MRDALRALTANFFDELIAQAILVYAASLRPVVPTRASVWPPPRRGDATGGETRRAGRALDEDGLVRKRLNALDVRTKLLLMLGVLSLPLLIVGLYQLHSLPQEPERTVGGRRAHGAEAAAAALESWIESQPGAGRGPDALSTKENARAFRASDAPRAAGLGVGHRGLRRAGARGLVNAGAQLPTPVEPPRKAGWPKRRESPAKVWQTDWSDGASRVTAVDTNVAFGWSVASACPRRRGLPAGRSILLLAVAWMPDAHRLVLPRGVGRRPLHADRSRSLVTSASALGEGNLHERARVETDDEVGSLARASTRWPRASNRSSRR